MSTLQDNRRLSLSRLGLIKNMYSFSPVTREFKKYVPTKPATRSLRTDTLESLVTGVPIKGIVRSGMRKALKGVSVSVFELNMEEHSFINLNNHHVSDELGAFSLSAPKKASTLMLIFSAPGLDEVQSLVDLTDNSNTDLQIKMIKKKDEPED